MYTRICNNKILHAEDNANDLIRTSSTTKTPTPRLIPEEKILDANQTQNKATGQKELFPHTSYIYHDGQSLYLDWSRCFCRLSLCLARSIHWIHPVLLG